jgi:DNA-binding transcriptional regulator YdaS (Cro superfamily)
MSKTVTEQVAQEKKRMALRLGKSPEKAEQWAQEVRDYDAANRKSGGKR